MQIMNYNLQTHPCVTHWSSVTGLKKMLLCSRLLKTVTTWGQSCSAVSNLSRTSVHVLQRVHVMDEWLMLILKYWMHVFAFAWFVFFTLCSSVFFHYTPSLRPSWVLWSLHARFWRTMKRGVLRGSRLTLLSSFTPTWLNWMGTSRSDILTTSSATYRNMCKCCLCKCVCCAGIHRCEDFGGTKPTSLLPVIGGRVDVGVGKMRPFICISNSQIISHLNKLPFDQLQPFQP